LSNRLLKHLFFWSAFTIYACIIDPLEGTLIAQTIGTSSILLGYIFIYYTGLLYTFPRFYTKRIKLIFLIFLTFFIYCVFDYIFLRLFFEKYIVTPPQGDNPTYSFIFSEIFTFGIIYILALGAYQNKIGIEKLKFKGEQEKALLLKELGFLKNQFNSHITFNFLNYCYSKIHKDSVETAEAIEIFSRMLRYSLNSRANEKVQLAKEIEYIEDFIRLQKLLSTDVSVQFLINENEENSIYILPRILIAFVENAFKHGNLHSKNNPISIELQSSSKGLNFKVTNEKNKHKIIEPSGIGHYNLKQQLELLYKNKYTLEIEDMDITYSSNLKLMIS
jgi:two-component system LytT family sensor kinase